MRSASSCIMSSRRSLGDVLVVGGVVPAGEGIVFAPIAGDGAGEFAILNGGSAFEHEMFEKVREAGAAFGFVRRADHIPDHMRDDGRAVAGDDDEGQAIGQREDFGLEEAAFRRRGIGRRSQTELIGGRRRGGLLFLMFFFGPGARGGRGPLACARLDRPA